MEDNNNNKIICKVCCKSNNEVTFSQYNKTCNRCKNLKYKQDNPDYMREYMKVYMKKKYIPVENKKKLGRPQKNVEIIN